jgi:hypothetical protein
LSEIAKNATSAVTAADRATLLWAALLFVQLFSQQQGGTTAVKLPLLDAAVPSQLATLAMLTAIWIIPLYAASLLRKAGETFRLLPSEAKDIVRTYPSPATFKSRDWCKWLVGVPAFYQFGLGMLPFLPASGTSNLLAAISGLVFAFPALWLLITLHTWDRADA